MWGLGRIFMPHTISTARKSAPTPTSLRTPPVSPMTPQPCPSAQPPAPLTPKHPHFQLKNPMRSPMTSLLNPSRNVTHDTTTPATAYQPSPPKKHKELYKTISNSQQKRMFSAKIISNSQQNGTFS